MYTDLFEALYVHIYLLLIKENMFVTKQLPMSCYYYLLRFNLINHVFQLNRMIPGSNVVNENKKTPSVNMYTLPDFSLMSVLDVIVSVDSKSPTVALKD